MHSKRPDFHLNQVVSKCPNCFLSQYSIVFLESHIWSWMP